MTLSEKIKNRILKFLGLDHLSDNPNSDRYTYLGEPELIIKKKVEENKVWYYGDSNELLNFYTAQQTYGNMTNPIYNRNKAQYFWGKSSEEMHIKRVHSGVPNAIVTTIVNLVGTGTINSEKYKDDIDKIVKRTGLVNLINQKQMPLTLAIGWGAFKPIIDTEVDSECPLLEWYDGDDVDFIKKHGKIIGLIFKDYYKYKNQDYVLTETRRIVDKSSRFEYNLYKLGKNNEVEEVELSTIPELAKLENYEIAGLNRVMGVPSWYFYDLNNENGGRSIFTGKIDLFDDLDQDLSQASQTSRVSTPVEYYPVDLIERGRNGEARLPQIYNRQYVASNAYPNGDGELNGEIKTTQPQLNFNQYTDKCMADLDFILSGLLSPATFGLNVAKDDSALAQREKEKVSIMTRNNIIDRQQDIIKETIEQLLILKEYMEKGSVTITDYDITVKFDEYATPSFESVSQNLIGLLTSGGITPEMYVDKLYGDSLSEEDREREISYIKEKQEQDQYDSGEFENLDGIGYDNRTTSDTDSQSNAQEKLFNIKR